MQKGFALLNQFRVGKQIVGVSINWKMSNRDVKQVVYLRREERY